MGLEAAGGTDAVSRKLLNFPLTFPPVFPRPTALIDGLVLKVAGPKDFPFRMNLYVHLGPVVLRIMDTALVPGLSGG